jgi:hypothetical protein
MRYLGQHASIRWSVAAVLLGVIVLGAYWQLARRVQAADVPRQEQSQKREVDPDQQKFRAAKELEALMAMFAGSSVTIFSKDAGPVEGVAIVGTIDFRGVTFLHLQNRKTGKQLLLRAENITLIRED